MTHQGFALNTPFGWCSNAETWWKFYDEREWLMGGFIWTGIDYRGEPSPYRWPCVNSHFGVMDVCGFAKNNYYYYKSWWTDEDVLHIFPHWNWAGKVGENINVWCYTNCEEVELFLNGKSDKPGSVVRLGDYKLIFRHEDDSYELYNLKYDLSETRNLIEKEPEKANELKQILNDWLKETNAQMPYKNPNFKEK